ncbi:MAG: xanthine dehydrogenase [Rhodospirillaceae bacterium]|nr:xanthine dehydrogenase [Rhodospirillaceae bacterium]
MKKNSFLPLLTSWIENNHSACLAIVISTWGSAPRQPGSTMVVRDDLHVEGSVSGGCVEGEVIRLSQEIMMDGIPRLKQFGVADESAWEVGLSCGGNISVLILPVADTGISLSILKQLTAAESKRKPLDVIFNISDIEKINIIIQNPSLPMNFVHKSTYNEKEQIFTLRIRPCNQVIIVGAGHISQVLSQLSVAMDLDVTVIDPRSVFLNEKRFPDIEIRLGWPQDVLPNLSIDAQTAIVTLTHDPKIDDPALLHSLNTNAYYIGCLGSTKTHQARLKRLKMVGVSDKSVSRLYGPAGIPLGGRAASEIALSILAELVSIFNKPNN